MHHYVHVLTNLIKHILFPPPECLYTKVRYFILKSGWRSKSSSPDSSIRFIYIFKRYLLTSASVPTTSNHSFSTLFSCVNIFPRTHSIDTNALSKYGFVSSHIFDAPPRGAKVPVVGEALNIQHLSSVFVGRMNAWNLSHDLSSFWIVIVCNVLRSSNMRKGDGLKGVNEGGRYFS